MASHLGLFRSGSLQSVERTFMHIWKRLGALVALAILLWAAFGYFSAQSACAHDPRFACSPRTAQNPVHIPDASKSWAFYGTLRRGETDRYEFDLPMRTTVPVNLLVDVRDSNNPARPALTIERDGESIKSIDFSRAGKFYEPFSRENYVDTPSQDLVLDPGHYTATVSMNGEAPQRYTLAIGEAERFTVFEIPYVAGAIHRIRALQYAR